MKQAWFDFEFLEKKNKKIKNRHVFESKKSEIESQREPFFFFFNLFTRQKIIKFCY